MGSCDVSPIFFPLTNPTSPHQPTLVHTCSSGASCDAWPTKTSGREDQMALRGGPERRGGAAVRTRSLGTEGGWRARNAVIEKEWGMPAHAWVCLHQ